MLEGIHKKLLIDIFLKIFEGNKEINALKYRADHENQLAELDALERMAFLERKDNKYYISLLALAELEPEQKIAKSFLLKCEHIFNISRSSYKKYPGEKINIVNLSKDTNLPEEEIRKCLVYMVKAPIWGSYSNDLLNTKDIQIAPSENILKYKSFQDVLNQIKNWRKEECIKTFSSEEISNIPIFLKEINLSENEYLFPKPPWYSELKPQIRSLMDEIYYALRKEMRALPSMGIRAVVDAVCNDLVGDVGGFSQKLDLLEKERHITSRNRNILENALEVGHASIHRGHFPELKDLKSLLSIIEHFLHEVYVLDKESKRLKSVTPKRKVNK